MVHNPPHPGSILKDALPHIPMTVTEFAKHIGVTRVTLSRILNGRAGITPDMSIRIAEAFGQPSRDIWFKLQNDYDFWQAGKRRRKKVARIKVAATRMEQAAA